MDKKRSDDEGVASTQTWLVYLAEEPNEFPPMTLLEANKVHYGY